MRNTNIKSIRLSDILEETASALEKGAFPRPLADAEYIVTEALSISRLELHADKFMPLSPEAAENIRRNTARRLAGEPLQYIYGKAYFRELILNVGPGVLIPRPETEILAGTITETAPVKPSICDVGTGSGAIALSVAHERKDARVTGIDISPEALKYAEANRRRYGLENARFIQGNLLGAVKGVKFHLIAANLPYVSEDELKVLPEEVGRFEPELALAGGYDGLDLIVRLIEQVPHFLFENGLLMLELGINQAEKVREILSEAKFNEIQIKKDFNGIERFIVARHI